MDREVSDLREALREAEMKAKKQEEERDQALQKLQTSTEVSSKLYEENLTFYLPPKVTALQAFVVLMRPDTEDTAESNRGDESEAEPHQTESH